MNALYNKKETTHSTCGSNVLFVIIAWCVLRGAAGTWGALRLGASRDWNSWTEVVLLFIVEGVMWFWIAFALMSRWNVGRIVAIVWCSMLAAMAGHGFMTITSTRTPTVRDYLLLFLTVGINISIVICLSRSRLKRLFTA